MKLQIKIREVCESRGVKTGYELKQIAQLHPSTAYRLFRNEVSVITVETLEKLCFALDCEPNDLFVKVKPPINER